jgi:hypothetical protein
MREVGIGRDWMLGITSEKRWRGLPAAGLPNWHLLHAQCQGRGGAKAGAGCEEQ